MFVDATQWKTKKGGTVLEKTERLNSMNERVSGVGDVRLLSTRLYHRLGAHSCSLVLWGRGLYSGDHRAAQQPSIACYPGIMVTEAVREGDVELDRVGVGPRR
jgi:hypothetical protein